jgi:hypothetical protein
LRNTVSQQRLENYNLQLPIFVNKVWSKHSNSHSSMCHLFLHKLKIFSIWPFMEKVCQAFLYSNENEWTSTIIIF